MIPRESCIIHYFHTDENNSLVYLHFLHLSYLAWYSHLQPVHQNSKLLHTMIQRTISRLHANITRTFLPQFYIPDSGKLHISISKSTLTNGFSISINRSLPERSWMFCLISLFYSFLCFRSLSLLPLFPVLCMSSFSLLYFIFLTHFSCAVNFFHCFSIFSSPVFSLPIFKISLAGSSIAKFIL